MKWLFYETETDTKAKVMLIYSIEPPAELKDKGNYIVLESMPKAENQTNKSALLYCNPQTGEFWYEYKDAIKFEETQKELNAKLLKDSANMQIELNKQKKLNSNLLLKIANLEGKLNV